MSGNIDHGPASDSPLGVRPLPPWPNLEFEHKRAKKLLARLHAGDSDALTEVRGRLGTHAPSSAGDFKLADAQFATARAYGFSSWPRLVEYFTTADRHARSGEPMAWYPRDHFERRARSLMAAHRAGSVWAGRWLAAFVPRFYGVSVREVFASAVNDDDARLAIARENKRPSWEALVQWIDSKPREDPWVRRENPLTRASKAVGEGNLVALEQIVDAHPELLYPRRDGAPLGVSLARYAVWYERPARAPNSRLITDWLQARGADVTEALNTMLLGGWGPRATMTVEDVEYWLGRGADPTWGPPNGISVLEHAIYKYWNGGAVDVIARRVEPRGAFWVAAGLGDVWSLDRYVDRHGVPSDVARRRRPDFTAMGPIPHPSLAEADDLEIIWEAFMVAGLNSRFAVLDWLLARGFPIDHEGHRSILRFAIGNRLVLLVEYLVSRGANLDLEQGSSDTPRRIAEEHFEVDPSNADSRRILELCRGRDPETLLRTAAEKRAKTMQVAPKVVQLLEAAQDDAARLGQDVVQPENVFVVMLRDNPGLPLAFLSEAGFDLEKLRRWVQERLVAGNTAAASPTTRSLQASGDLETVLKAARAEAEKHRRDMVTGLHVLYALLASDTGPIADILREAGGTLEKAREELARAL